MAQLTQLVTAAMNDPEELVVDALALASAELTTRAMPKTTESALRFMAFFSECELVQIFCGFCVTGFPVTAEGVVPRNVCG
jgi:hypothetical protein